MRVPRGGREHAPFQRLGVGDLLELPALAEQRGQPLPELGLDAAHDAMRREQHQARVVAVREVHGREVVGPQLGRIAIGRAPLVAVGQRRLVAVVAVDDRQRTEPTTLGGDALGLASQTRQSRCEVPSSSVVSSSGARPDTNASNASLMRRDGSP